MSIIDLQEISPDWWKAKYRGNYGTYTIKIKTDGKKRSDFSCSCPSDYYPCKHIPMVEDAIRERITKSKKNEAVQELTLEQLLKGLSQCELCNFIVRHAQHNLQFRNTVLLEFAHKATKTDTTGVNNYNQLLQDALDGLNFDYEDIDYGHYNDCIEVDVMGQWLDKAQKFVDQNNPEEALLICKACIEEYASWLEGQDDAIVDYFDTGYQERPFDILEQIATAKGTDCKALLEYCKSEMSKPKYRGTEMHDGFNALLLELSVMVGSDDFITLQDNLLQGIEDKSSYEAQKILHRKIDFYRNNNQPEKADKVVRENLQIESFREDLTTRLIAANKLKEAKKLINDFIAAKGNESRNLHAWHKLRLQIAQKENDVPEIRRVAFMFIESHFHADYYQMYKSTFTKEEWPAKMDKLIAHYEKKNTYQWFRSSVADVLQAEKQEERLMKYIEKHLSIDNLESYYAGFSSAFPEKTLALFRQVIDQHARNTGREIYERIVKLFAKMAKIQGGNELVREMISQYRIIYRNRRAMMEVMNKYKL